MAEKERDTLAMHTITIADMIGEGRLDGLMKERELQKIEMECDIKICRELSDIELRRLLYGVVELILADLQMKSQIEFSYIR